ncbi:MAG: hypothetical protein NTW67_04225 [Candidatus Woesearchaeota archaeon]|nr:hypothetical protein [Candidatus Woesearchaeota archaeon]
MVKHKITCPKCRNTYDFIVDKKCETKNCGVWFFWDELDCHVFARWLKSKPTPIESLKGVLKHVKKSSVELQHENRKI